MPLSSHLFIFLEFFAPRVLNLKLMVLFEITLFLRLMTCVLSLAKGESIVVITEIISS